ncbi:glycosyltransferase [Tateyamaria omphalii]|uniref:glycosyltransferase n=1 Tax=Tateyamaria omphalii TaxID=299262 RepID=UPI001C990341|nr:glycosyltransferase [Tateyamaria omphalii]MBY5934982.1 glycosyltransferase [Tateyamaria omphalii]
MSLPSLSYILLTYNQRDTVRAAVESALGQTGVQLEIVISDDHSKDDTFDVIQQTVAGYDGPHQIILNRNPQNLGLAGNLDKVHQLSSGDVLIAAAGDDKSYPHRSERIAQAFEREDCLLLCSYADVIDPDDKPVHGNFRTALFYNTWDAARAARSKALYIGATGAWHRSLYEDFGALDPEAYEDLVLGFRAALENRVTVIKEELVQYRLGTGLTSSDGYHADIAAFQARRKKGFTATRAIMRQRKLDARHFGLPDEHRILRILQREQVKADLGTALYSDEAGAFLAMALRHPFLAFYIWKSERRRARKMMRKLTMQHG